MEIAKLLEERNFIQSGLCFLIYGSIEIRKSNGKKFIYIHFRKDGKQHTKYVGEYSDELYEVIIKNNNTARAYKKRLREIEKEKSDRSH
ncbi:hypothetical protein, partial [Pseudobutyrivibrio sp.]